MSLHQGNTERDREKIGSRVKPSANRLAILEEEKAAADTRLEDEFRRRFENEEEFYQKKRALLEEAAAKVQQDAYVTMDNGKTDP